MRNHRVKIRESNFTFINKYENNTLNKLTIKNSITTPKPLKKAQSKGLK